MENTGPTTVADLVSQVDLSQVSLGILAIALVLTNLEAITKGAQKVLSFLKRG